MNYLFMQLRVVSKVIAIKELKAEKNLSDPTFQ